MPDPGAPNRKFRQRRNGGPRAYDPRRAPVVRRHGDHAIGATGEIVRMTDDQRKVAIGAACGIVSMVLAMALLPGALPVPDGMTTVGERLGYAVRWDVFAALPLFLMIGAVGNGRAMSKAIDPTLGLEDRKIVVNGRVADNTTQQYLLFLAASLGLAAGLPPDRMTVIGAAALWFVFARIAFWIGYRIHPLYRAYGFAGTAYLNLLLLLAALWLALD